MLVNTPDGRQVYIPDGIVPPPLDIAHGGMGGSSGGMQGGQVPPPPPPPPPLKFGPGGSVPTEIAGPGAPNPELPQSVTGGALPTPDQSAAPMAQPLVPPDVNVGFKEPSAADIKARQKADAAAAKKQAAQAAFDATPEGQSQIAAEERRRALEDQAEIARRSSEVEQREGVATAGIENEGFKRAEELRKKAAEENAARQAGTAERQKTYDAAVKAETDYKVDDNRRWKEMGTGRKIGFWIMAALSGLGDALQHKSGPNMVLGMMQDTIQRDVAAQMREREQLGKRIGVQKNSLDTYVQQTQSLSDAHRLKLSEEYDRTAQQIRAASAQYSSDKAKARGEMLAAQFEDQAGALRYQVAGDAFNRDMKRQEMANQKAQVGIAAGHLSLSRQQFEYQKKHDQDVLDLEADKLDRSGKAQAAQQVREGGIGNAQVLIGPDKKPVLDEQGKPIMKPDVMRQSDGTPWVLDKESAAKVRPIKASVDTITTVLDEVRAKRTGWTSNTWNSPENAQLRTDWEAARQAAKELLNLGQLQGDESKMLNDFLGTADPTGWKDPQAGMEQARTNVLRIANNKFRAYGYAGDYSPPDLGKLAEPTTTEQDAALQKAIATSGNTTTTRTYHGEKDTNVNPQGVQAQNDALRTVDGYGAMLKSTDTAAANSAVTALTRLRDEALSPAVRARAKSLLDANVGTQSEKYQAGPSTATAHESEPLYSPEPRPEANKPRKR